ncbi:MAG: GGDEF domain-containing protein [Geobacteraceae bacterium]|nr:GGDEF domain-containing protein [Geobacteraceae bacterium]NTW78828.1 GGDEF domain-containing protein [Geobacteraceae bacterium]
MFIFVIPASILITTWLLAPQMSSLTPEHLELAVLSPYLITALGMFLAIHFHRGRPFMVLLLLLLFYWSSQNFLVGKSIELSLNEIYQAIVLLIPINIALIAVMRERGFLTTAGRLRFVFLAVQALVAFWLFRYNFFAILPHIAGNYPMLQFLDGMLIPEPALVVGSLSFALIAGLAMYRQTPIDCGMVGAFASFFVACNWITNRDIYTAFCISGSAIITLSILRDSYKMAFCDDLTGLPSRRSLNENLHGLGRSYTVAMLDVDHFKNFNDTYGHDVGDQVLKMVARKIMDVGGGGKAYRYGGEEFTILFPGRHADYAIPHLEELRKSIADYQLALRGSERPKSQKQGAVKRGNRREGAYASVTISIGVAERNESLTSTEEVMKAADKALYKAKSRGRNQVSC